MIPCPWAMEEDDEFNELDSLIAEASVDMSQHGSLKSISSSAAASKTDSQLAGTVGT